MLIGIVIQARMGSTRLPGKILSMIGNKTLLEHIFYRLSFLKTDVIIILATSNLEKDNQVEEFCKSKNITCFRGNEENVLERYYLCAKKYKLDHVIRMTGDNPFPDIIELDNLIKLHLETCSDFTHSFDVLPKGIGAEIFTFNALEKSYLYGLKPHHIEHVDEYLIENPQLFKIVLLNTPNEKNRPDISVTIDNAYDLKKACYIVENGSSEYLLTEEIINLAEKFSLLGV